jgi:hypothetical protein
VAVSALIEISGNVGTPLRLTKMVLDVVLDVEEQARTFEDLPCTVYVPNKSKLKLRNELNNLKKGVKRGARKVLDKHINTVATTLMNMMPGQH